MQFSDKFRRLRNRVNIRRSFRRLFDSPDGQLVLEHIIKEGFVFSTTAVKDVTGKIDVNATLLNEGSRRMALSIMQHASVDEAKLLRMLEQIEQTKETNA